MSIAPPPGYPGPNGDTSYGYDALPVYNYSASIPACDESQAKDQTPWINLDETDQITLDKMYAGVVAASSSLRNSSPQLVRFLAKANRLQYVYVARNSNPNDPNRLWWAKIPQKVVDDTAAYLEAKKTSPPEGSANYVSVPNGTIEMKAAWRPLNPAEVSSGRFHMQTVRFYDLTAPGGSSECYRDAKWGLIALHIIQKTPSAPYFIYATFEQADNLLTVDGRRVEDADGKINLLPPGAATTPQVCLSDTKPQNMPPPPNGQELTSQLGSVIVTANPATCKPDSNVVYCDLPGRRLYYRNEAPSADFPATNGAPHGGNICVDKRDNAIPDYVIKANVRAHAAIATYLKQNNISSAPWLSYKLVNVQYFPYDKIPNPNDPNGSLYTAQPPYTAKNPAPSNYYQANIVVETNRSLQLFSGGLSPNVSTDWNTDGTPHKNTYYGGHFYNMGGCMGCHGSQGQNPRDRMTGVRQAGDFSVILARGTVELPETPQSGSVTAQILLRRNRSLSR